MCCVFWKVFIVYPGERGKGTGGAKVQLLKRRVLHVKGFFTFLFSI